MEVVLDIVDGWLAKNPHSCAVIVVYVLVPLVISMAASHGLLYKQMKIIRQVLKMRKGDWWKLTPPRTPPLRKPKTIPPTQTFDDTTPKD